MQSDLKSQTIFIKMIQGFLIGNHNQEFNLSKQNVKDLLRDELHRLSCARKKKSNF